MAEKEILSYADLTPAKKRKKAERKNPYEPIAPAEGSRKDPTRVGRGRRSGSGKTSGRGQKGQKSRSGYSRRAGFEGGQMPLHRRLPKRGFRNIFSNVYQTVNLWRIEKAGATGDLGPEQMVKLGLVHSQTRPIKVLGTGSIKGSLTVTADAFSSSAKSAIEAAGGRCNLREKRVAKVAGSE